jgi:hypothetical protein
MVQKLCQATAANKPATAAQTGAPASDPSIKIVSHAPRRADGMLKPPLHNFTARKRIRNSGLLKYQHASTTQRAPLIDKGALNEQANP